MAALPKQLRRQIQRELKHLEAAPVPLTGLAVNNENLLEWHLNVKITHGVYKDVTFHGIMTIQPTYPATRPRMRLCHPIHHEHVHDGEVCLGMFDNFKTWFAHVDKQGKGKGKAEAQAVDWSAGYDLSIILVILQAFLAKPEKKVSAKAVEEVRRAAAEFTCTCGHTSADPCPELAPGNAQPTTADPSAVQCSFNRTPHTDESDILGLAFAPTYTGDARLRNLATSADIVSYSAFQSGKRSVVPGNEWNYFMPLYISASHWARASDLAHRTIAGVMSRSPSARKELEHPCMAEKPAPPLVDAAPELARLPALQHGSSSDGPASQPQEQPILLRGNDGAYRIVNSENYDSDLEEEQQQLPAAPLIQQHGPPPAGSVFARDVDSVSIVTSTADEDEGRSLCGDDDAYSVTLSRASSSVSLCSMSSELQATDSEGVLASPGAGDRTPPRQGNPGHFPHLALKFTIKFMNQLVVQFSKMGAEEHPRLDISERVVNAYCQLHFLLIRLVEDHPDILEESNKRLQVFCKDSRSRRRETTPDLGELLQLLTITSHTWDDIREGYFQENMFRQCRWICKHKDKSIRSLANIKEGPTPVNKTRRLKLAFKCAEVSSRILLFNLAFQDLLLYKQQGQTRVKMTLAEMSERYRQSCGTADPDQCRKLIEQRKQQHVTSYMEWMEHVGFRPRPTEDVVYGRLIEAMRNHKKVEKRNSDSRSSSRRGSQLRSPPPRDDGWTRVGKQKAGGGHGRHQSAPNSRRNRNGRRPNSAISHARHLSAPNTPHRHTRPMADRQRPPNGAGAGSRHPPQSPHSPSSRGRNRGWGRGWGPSRAAPPQGQGCVRPAVVMPLPAPGPHPNSYAAVAKPEAPPPPPTARPHRPAPAPVASSGPASPAVAVTARSWGPAPAGRPAPVHSPGHGSSGTSAPQRGINSTASPPRSTQPPPWKRPAQPAARGSSEWPPLRDGRRRSGPDPGATKERIGLDRQSSLPNPPGGDARGPPRPPALDCLNSGPTIHFGALPDHIQPAQRARRSIEGPVHSLQSTPATTTAGAGYPAGGSAGPAPPVVLQFGGPPPPPSPSLAAPAGSSPTAHSARQRPSGRPPPAPRSGSGAGAGAGLRASARPFQPSPSAAAAAAAALVPSAPEFVPGAPASWRRQQPGP